VLVNKFDEGLKPLYPNNEERYRVIVEECIYFNDINPTNIYICKLLLNRGKNYKLNCNIGNTLTLNIQNIWGITKFDAIVGNPPYSTDPSKQDSKPLYNLFIEECDKICKTYLLFVIPSRWFMGGKGLDKFRKSMIKRKDIKTIVHEDNASKWFGNDVNIMGGCCYILIDKGYSGTCMFNDVEYNLSQYDFVLHPKYHKLVDILRKFKSIEDIYLNRNTYGLETNDKRISDTGAIKVYVSSKKTESRIKYTNDASIFNKDNTTPKVITSRANGNKLSFSGFKKYLPENEAFTSSYVGFRVQNENEADSLISYLNCSLTNKILGIRKITQDINTDVIRLIPLVPLDRIWTDEKLYEFFNISKDIVKF
jgi:site-specific DNA-methyltransferase (adenine-specific)